MRASSVLTRRTILSGAFAAGAGLTSAELAITASAHQAWADDASDAAANDVWPDLAAQIFPGKTIGDATGLLAVDAPYRAQDAAIVPISLRLDSAQAARVRALTLVIDHNPSPLAGTFMLGAGAGITQLSTAVRVNDYTFIHAVAELDDGTLHATRRFVKAAGGCSAPGLADASGGPSRGSMRFREFPPASPGQEAQAQLVIRHPNFSGMQMNQLTHLYIPALFLQHVRLWQGDALLLSVEGGISIAEDPRFRFTFRPNGAHAFRAQAIDSAGQVYTASWPATPAT